MERIIADISKDTAEEDMAEAVTALPDIRKIQAGDTIQIPAQTIRLHPIKDSCPVAIRVFNPAIPKASSRKAAFSPHMRHRANHARDAVCLSKADTHFAKAAGIGLQGGNMRERG